MLFWVGRLQRGASQNGFGLILPGLGVAFIASLALSLYWTKNMPQAAFYLMPSRIWQLSLGAIVYFTFQSSLSASDGPVQNSSNVSTYLTLATGLILILGSAIALSPGLAYPGFWALVPALGAALVIGAGHTLSKGRGGHLPIRSWFGWETAPTPCIFGIGLFSLLVFHWVFKVSQSRPWA